jgi:glucose-6-phosphate dehydrogenase assembly protein OpcA
MIAADLSAKLHTIRTELAAAVSTATLNFLVHIDDRDDRSWILARTELIAAKHPTRTIVLDACDTRHDVRLVHNHIEIGIGEMAPADIVELVCSLFLSDIPTVLWWTADVISDQPHLPALLEIADGLVVDSSGSTSDHHAVVELANFSARAPNVIVSDISWMRLRPWQDIIAHFFDDPDTLQEELFSIRRLRIDSGSEAEALYLGAWLASRLGWTASTHEAFRDRGGTLIPFERVRDGALRRVRSVRIETTQSTYEATLTDDEDVVRVLVTGAAMRPERFVPLQAVDNPSLVERAILATATDEFFKTALQTVAQIVPNAEG